MASSAFAARVTSYPRRANAFRIARRKGSSSSTIKIRGMERYLLARLGNRQGNLCATPFGRADRHLASLAFHDVAGEVETEAGAAPRLLGGEERLADAAQQVLRNAHPVVGDGEPQRIAGAGERDANVARLAALGCLEGVVEEVRDRLLEGAHRQPDPGPLGVRLDLELGPRRRPALLPAAGGVAQHRSDLELLRLLAGDVDARSEHAGDDLLAAPHLPADLLRLLLARPVELCGQLAGEDGDGPEWRVQLVRGAGGYRTEGSETLLRLGIRPRARKLLVAVPQRLAHSQREGGDEGSGDEEGDPAASQMQEADVLGTERTLREEVQERECPPAHAGEPDAPASG